MARTVGDGRGVQTEQGRRRAESEAADQLDKKGEDGGGLA